MFLLGRKLPGEPPTSTHRRQWAIYAMAMFHLQMVLICLNPMGKTLQNPHCSWLNMVKSHEGSHENEKLINTEINIYIYYKLLYIPMKNYYNVIN